MFVYLFDGVCVYVLWATTTILQDISGQDKFCRIKQTCARSISVQLRPRNQFENKNKNSTFTWKGYTFFHLQIPSSLRSFSLSQCKAKAKYRIHEPKDQVVESTCNSRTSADCKMSTDNLRNRKKDMRPLLWKRRHRIILTNL